jgi:UDP:flavonoid glycosyltransferase YjiC (YdhE family)
MRYLFVTVDSAGALYPQLALAHRVAARGHDVRFLSCRSQEAAIRRAGFRVETYSGAPDFDMSDRDGAIRDWLDDPQTSFKTCCEVIWFGPAQAVANDVVATVGRDPVDVLVLDYFAFGAAIAGEVLGLPTAVLWHTTYGEWPSWDDAGLPAVNEARVNLGLAPDRSVYAAYRRADRILALSTEVFAGAPPVPANFRYVGPQLPPGPAPLLTSRGPVDRPAVLVCLGTSYQAQEGLLARIVAALGRLPVRALVTTGGAVAYDGDPPDNVEVVPWVSHSEVLPRTDLVITHGGLGTIMTALAFGVPLLCVPIGRDQHANAARVGELGYGCEIEACDDVDALCLAIDRAVGDQGSQQRIREAALACATGLDDGAIELERLATPIAARRA